MKTSELHRGAGRRSGSGAGPASTGGSRRRLRSGLSVSTGALSACCSARGRTSPPASRRCASDLKFVDAFALRPAVASARRCGSPARTPSPRALALWLLAPLILLGAGVSAELLVVPQSEWMSRLVGAECDVLHDGPIPMLAAPHPRGAHCRDARRRAAPSGLDGRAGGRSLRRSRRAALRLALPRRFAAVRRDLVSARAPSSARGGASGALALVGAAVVRAWLTRDRLRSRIALFLDQRIEDRLQLVHG